MTKDFPHGEVCSAVAAISQKLRGVCRPGIAQEIERWMSSLSPTDHPSGYFTQQAMFPMFLLPAWMATSSGGWDGQFQSDLVYSTVNGYYFIRLLDNVMDGHFTVERELLPMCRALGLGVTAWSPLSGGVLSGKYANKESAQARYSNEAMRQFMPDEQRADRAVAALKTVAGQTGRSLAQVALAWLRYRDQPIIPILGARKLAQLQDNIASLELALSPEQVRLLDDATRIEMGVPHSFFARERVQELAYGGLRDRIVA